MPCQHLAAQIEHITDLFGRLQARVGPSGSTDPATAALWRESAAALAALADPAVQGPREMAPPLPVRQEAAVRDQADPTLQASEERFRFLAESIPHMVWSARPDGVSDYYNARFLAYLGKTREEMEGWTWVTTLHPDDRPVAVDRWTAAFSTGSEYHIEFRIQRAADGQYRWFQGHAVPQRDAANHIVRWYGTCTDIDDRKRAEAALREAHDGLERKVTERTAQLSAASEVLRTEVARHERTEALLRESEERYRAVVEGAGETIATVDARGVFLFMNHTAAERLGGRPEELIGQSMGDLFPPPMAQRQLATIQRVIQTGRGEVADTVTYVHGQPRHYVTTIQPLPDAAGRITAAVVIARDVTARRQAEQALRDSEEKYHRLFDTISEAVHILDPEAFRFIDVNRAAEQLYGYTREEFLALRPSELSAEPEASAQTLAGLLRGENPRVTLRQHRKKDGTVFFVEISACVYEIGGRRVVCGICRDITARRLAEQALRDSEEKYHRFFDTISDAVVIVDAATRRFIEANEYALKLFGYRREELVGLRVEDLTAEPEATNQKYHELLQEKPIAIPLRFYRKKDGTVFPVEINASTYHLGGRLLFCGVLRDITARRQAEEKLRLHAAMMDNIAEGIFLIGLEDLLIKWTNDKFAKMFGYDPGEMVGRPVDIVNAPNEKTPAQTRSAIVDLLRKNGQWHGEVENLRRDGTRFWCSCNVSLFDHPEYGRVMVSVHTDITERKKNEAALLASAREIHDLFDHAPCGYHSLNRAGVIVNINETELSWLGYTHEEMVGKPIRDFLTPVGRESFARNYPLLLDRSEVHDLEFDLVRKDGTLLPTLVNATVVRDAAGRFLMSRSSVYDNTLRKRTEQTLQDSEERFRTLIEKAPLAIGLSRNGRNLYCNHKYLQLFGFPTRAACLERPIVEHFAPECRADMAERIRRRNLGQPVPDQYEALGQRPDGTHIPVHIAVATVQLADGPASIGFISDISARRRAEESLRQSEQSLHEAQRLAKLGNWIFEVESGKSRWSPELCRIMGWDPGRPPPGYAEHRTLFTPESWARLDLAAQQALSTGAGYDLELEVIHADGQHLWIQDRGEAVRDDRNRVVQLRGTVQDITERIQTRRNLEHYQQNLKLLAHQVLLVEERERRRLATDLHDGLGQTLTLARMKLSTLHHSIRARLMGQQCQEIEKLLDEALRSTSALTFELSPPVLHELGLVPAAHWLAEEMNRRYGLDIEVQDDGAPVAVTDQMAIVLFRCLRELLVNVAKHARVKNAHLHLHCERDCLYLTIRDEGVGFREKFESGTLQGKTTPGGFGLFSIRERLSQLGGGLVVDSSPGRGTTVTLTVPLPQGPVNKEDGS